MAILVSVVIVVVVRKVLSSVDQEPSEVLTVADPTPELVGH